MGAGDYGVLAQGSLLWLSSAPFRHSLDSPRQVGSELPTLTFPHRLVRKDTVSQESGPRPARGALAKGLAPSSTVTSPHRLETNKT